MIAWESENIWNLKALLLVNKEGKTPQEASIDYKGKREIRPTKINIVTL